VITVFGHRRERQLPFNHCTTSGYFHSPLRNLAFQCRSVDERSSRSFDSMAGCGNRRVTLLLWSIVEPAPTGPDGLPLCTRPERAARSPPAYAHQSLTFTSKYPARANRSATGRSWVVSDSRASVSAERDINIPSPIPRFASLEKVHLRLSTVGNL
jgi:hypothetical protein